MIKNLINICLSVSLFAQMAQAAPLVSQQTIDTQKKLTTVFKLKNGIPVIARSVPGSDIVQVNITFAQGLAQLQTPTEKIANRLLWGTLPRASTKYDKQAVFGMIERYSLELGCAGAIENSSCTLGTVNDYWSQGLGLLASLIKNPKLDNKDVNLDSDRLKADLLGAIEDPQSYVNEVVNRIYYPVNHPFRLQSLDAVEDLRKVTPQTLRTLHTSAMNASKIQITVVSSLPLAQLKTDLEKQFGQIPANSWTSPEPKHPTFEDKKSFEFEARNIPTAYILAKFPSPGAKDPDVVASALMFEILDQELSEEIRTRRSLSYSVYASAIRHTLGIGTVGASTSNPKETLEAMVSVIKSVKSKKLTPEKLDEYKNIFATSYFMTQESHASLANALATYYYHFKSIDPLYEMPQKLALVTPDDIQRLSEKYLKNMRVGIIFDRAKFQNSWGEEFVKNLKSP